MKLYHVSCQDNNNSIEEHGLVPNRFKGFEEKTSPYIYLAISLPTTRIENMTDKDVSGGNLLDSYLLLRSHEYETCKRFNLYEIETDGLDQRKFFTSLTGDPRELLYRGTIPPENIRYLKDYNTARLDNRYRRLHPEKPMMF